VAGPSRPSTSKTIPKPVKKYQKCRFFGTQRGCYSGEKCRFLHDAEEPPRELNKTCRFYAQGYCLHGAKCWYKHILPTSTTPNSSTVEPPSSPASSDTETENLCGICYEVPVEYGLMTNCSHAFCLTCLRDWRNSRKKDMSLVYSNIIKTCPLCRSPSRFITPSSHFYPLEDPRRQKMVDDYKASMARVPCRYFSNSNPNQPFCPYGDDCFYKHESGGGQSHNLGYGVDRMMSLFKEDLQTRRGSSRYRLMRHPPRFFEDDDGWSDGPDPIDAFTNARYSFTVDSEVLRAVHPTLPPILFGNVDEAESEFGNWGDIVRVSTRSPADNNQSTTPTDDDQAIDDVRNLYLWALEAMNIAEEDSTNEGS